MGKIIKFFVGLWLIWLPIATIIYVFSDGAIGKVKSVTIHKLIHLDTQTIDEASGESTPTEDRIQQIQSLDNMLTSHGDDVNASVFDRIQADPEVLNVTVEKQPIQAFKDTTLYSVVVSFTDEGYQVNVQFFATGKTFMYPFRAAIQSVNEIDISTESLIAATVPKTAAITDPANMIIFLANFTSKNPQPLQQVLPPDVWQALN
jgi:hypothetical protein